MICKFLGPQETEKSAQEARTRTLMRSDRSAHNHGGSMVVRFRVVVVNHRFGRCVGSGFDNGFETMLNDWFLIGGDSFDRSMIFWLRLFV